MRLQYNGLNYETLERFPAVSLQLNGFIIPRLEKSLLVLRIYSLTGALIFPFMVANCENSH